MTIFRKIKYLYQKAKGEFRQYKNLIIFNSTDRKKILASYGTFNKTIMFEKKHFRIHDKKFRKISQEEF